MFGVPKLLKSVVRGTVATLISNTVGKLYDFLFEPPKWGIYMPGSSTKAIDVSSVVSLDISGSADVSDYLIETGSFVSYNKVMLPDMFQVRITQDGLEAGRTYLLDWLQRAKENTYLYDVVCPEFVYPNSTLVRYTIDRSASSGATMITANCVFQQVREKPAQYSSSNIENPENQQTTPVVQVTPIKSSTITATDLGPL